MERTIADRGDNVTAAKQKWTAKRRTWVLINFGLILVLVVGVGAAGWFGYKWVTALNHNSGRDASVDASREAISTILKISPSTVDEDLARGEELTTGELQDEWIKKENQVRQSVKTQSASRSSKIIKAAYAKGDSDSASVILAVDTTTKWDAPVKSDGKDDGKGKGKGKGKDGKKDTGKDKNGDGIPDPIVDHYRITAEMSLVNDNWLLSSLDIG